MASQPTDKDGFGASLTEPEGISFGPYTLVRRLGVGGMAETYEAIRQGPGDFSQRVCLKLVLPYFRDRQDFLTLFQREARLAAKLRHGNVVGVIDFGEIDGVTYMALELVDGLDLAALLDAQPGSRVSVEHTVLVGHDIAAALEHAHDPRRGGSADGGTDNAIIHRDLSPSNVLVSQRGEILLTDFGVAKAITGTARQQSAVKGKVPYMSPEQLRSEGLDGRADLFALGVVLYESLAGHRPFQGDHDPATIMQILNGDRPPLLEAAPDTPPGLADIIERLLEPDRDARPGSASELLEMLDPYVPTPRERRELGKIVSVVRSSLTPPPLETPVNGSAATEGSGERNLEASSREPASGVSGKPAQTPPTAKQTEPRKASPWRWLAAALALAMAVGLGMMINQGGESSPAADDGTATSPAPVPARAAEAEPERANEEQAEAKAESEAPAESTAAAAQKLEPVAQAPKPGKLSVAVFPWGDVWIDGKSYGKAPVRRVALPAGRHKVSAGQGEPWKTRVVRVKPGQSLSVQFDLSE